MGTLVNDSFTRANSTTSLGTANSGQAWTVNTASETFGITSNQGVWVSGTASVWSAASINSNAADCSVSIDLDGASSNAGLVFRLSLAALRARPSTSACDAPRSG